MQQRQFAFAAKRITKDFKEIQEHPIDGVGMCQINSNDLFNFLVNIEIQTGPYSGLLVHMKLVLPDNYPSKPPRMIILPGQAYNNNFHHHIYQANEYEQGAYRFCIDMLDDAYMDTNNAGSGWNPAYTFSSLMMQMQNFLADPDFHSKFQELSPEQIERIRKQMSTYSIQHQIDGKPVTHSTAVPFPALARSSASETKPESIQSEESSVDQAHQRSLERLSCYMTKENILKNPTGIFGYPIMVTKDKFNRLLQKPIPEILSYEAYQSQLNASGYREPSLDTCFKTGNGQSYNMFLPIYINEEHYKQARQVLRSQLTYISSERYFEQQVLNVLPNLINKQLVALLDGAMHQSIAAIEAYVHFTQLFHSLIREDKRLKKEVDSRVERMGQSDQSRNKKNLGDIGEFLVILSGSSCPRSSEVMDLLFREYFARQIFWVTKNRDLLDKYRREKSISQKLAAVFEAASTSNKLLIFNVGAAKRFIDNKEYLINLAKNSYSMIAEKDAEEFIQSVNETIKETKSHADLMKFIGLGETYKTDEDCYELLKVAIAVSNLQAYTSFDLNLNQTHKPNLKTLEIYRDIQPKKFSFAAQQ